MIWEYMMDIGFVWIAVIGSIIALVYVYIQSPWKKQAK
ncbi:EYxxD motif small membrane protein [Bacillus sp. REN3]